MTPEDYVKSAKREKDVRNEIQKLSNGKLKVEFTGYGAGSDKKFKHRKPYDPNKPNPLDLLVNENIVIEVMGSDRWNFGPSKHFPVAMDKVDRSKGKLVYFVFVLDNESQPNMWWIKAEDCEDQPKEYEADTKYGPQNIYKTDKYLWHRGLQSLVDELLKRVNFKLNP